MTDETEWGPWIDHDGSGCPVPLGTVVWVEYKNKTNFWSNGSYTGESGTSRIVMTKHKGGSWSYGSVHDTSTWTDHPVVPGQKCTAVVRYRVKKPKAMKMIMELLENLPVTKLPEKEEV